MLLAQKHVCSRIVFLLRRYRSVKLPIRLWNMLAVIPSPFLFEEKMQKSPVGFPFIERLESARA
jgi:hypothetical protein